MQTGYFNAAWQDIKNSPGWVGKLALLSLIGLIPIFGWIVVAGYLLGWARDIAWKVHAPLPAHIFGNEDGRLYSRGFFSLVIGFIFMLAPWLLEIVWGVLTGVGTTWSGHAGHGGLFVAVGLSSMLFSLAILAVMFFAALFSWVGAMRMSVYGRLAAGFQLGRIWAMIRRDFTGLLRILGMAALLTVGASVIASVLLFFMIFLGIFIGMMVTGGNLGAQMAHSDAAILSIVFATGGFVLVLAVLYGIAGMIMTTFVAAMVARALGYWTRQFDVPAWRGQDDPMPFELEGSAGGSGGPGGFGQPPYGQPPTH